MSDLYNLALAFCTSLQQLTTKATPIIIINSVSGRTVT